MKKFLTFLICIILLGCNSGINSGIDNGNQNQDDPHDITLNKVLSLSSVATIPTVTDQQSSTTLLLTNNTGTVMRGITVSFAGGDYFGASIFSKCDRDLPVGQSCQISLNLPAELQQGSFELQAEGTSAKGQYTARQLISYANVTEINGIEAGEFNDQIVTTGGNKVTLAIPFRKVGNFSVHAQVDSSGDNDPVNETVCNSGDSQCTELVSITPHNDNEVSVSFLNNNSEILTTVSAAVIMNAVGNLIIPVNNVVISKADGVTSVSLQLLNNGYTAISNIRISSTNPAFGFNTDTCTTIAANSSCTASITANSKVNGFGSVTVMYDTTSSTGQVYQNKTTTFNASYLAESGAAGFGLTVSGDSFTNNWVGESRNAYLTIKNTGAVKIDSIHITSVVSQNANVSVVGYGTTACAIDGTQSLEPNASCVVKVNYNPSQSEAGNLIINFSGKYLNSGDISGSSSISILSDAINLNYNSNPRIVYLMTENSQNGVTRCNLTNNGKSLTDCSVTGISGSNNNSTVLSNARVLGLSSFMSNDGMFSAYVGNSGNGNFVKCNASESGLLSNCASVMFNSGLPMNGVSGTNLQNLIANINGKNYLYVAMADSGRGVNKCLISESNGSLSACVSEAAKLSITSLDRYFNGITVNNNYAYITGIDDNTTRNMTVCSINQTTGSFDTCTSTTLAINSKTDLYNSVIKTIGSIKYIFIVLNNGSSITGIGRCSINNTTGLLNNDCTEVVSPVGYRINGMALLTISGLDYLYYGDSSTNNVYRAQLNSDGTISNSEQVSTSGTRLTGTKYLSPLVEYPRVKIAYATSSNTYYPNNSYVESLYIAANVQMINKNTTVTLTAPTGISVSPATINFTSSTTTVPVSISIANGVAAGTYTITGVTANGLVVPDFAINVVNNGPKIVSYFPANNAGITNNASTSIYSKGGNLPAGTLNRIVNITFDKEVSTTEFVQKTAIRLQYSADNSNFSDIATDKYDWNFADFSKTANLVIDTYYGRQLVNGGYYRIMINKSLLKDSSGNVMDPTATKFEELMRFRAGLKIYVTTTTFTSDLRTAGGGTDGLDGADKICNFTANGKPNDGSYYKAMIGAGTFSNNASEMAGKTLNRYPGLNWVLFNNITYYGTISSSNITQVGTTDSSGKLTTTAQLGTVQVFTGFNSNWVVPGAGSTNNDACNNWSYSASGSSIKGYYGLTSKSANNALLYNTPSVCDLTKRAIICAQE